MTVIDAHAHFWDVGTLDYPWIAAGSRFDHSFLPEEYRRASAGLPIEAIVFVECDADPRCAVAEAEWVTRLAQSDPRIQAIVARVPLSEKDAMATLATLAAMPLVRGVRDNLQGHAPGFALQPHFVDGVRAVQAAGLHFELCLTHDQLDEATELVRRCPDGLFVLDHCAKPDIESGRRQPWQTQIHAMAGLPNVVCKISGLVTEAGEDWQPDDVLWYARAAAAAFGPDRILFGSDWPVNEAAGGQARWFQLAEALAAPWPERDRALFFHANAARVYRLGAAALASSRIMSAARSAII